jgi:hypothetical protein
MKYMVEVVATEYYRVIVEADSEDKAEESALNLEYSEMMTHSNTVEATVIETLKEN